MTFWTVPHLLTRRLVDLTAQHVRRDQIGKPSVFCPRPTPGQIHHLLTPPDTCGSSQIGRVGFVFPGLYVFLKLVQICTSININVKLPPIPGSMTSRETVCQRPPYLPLLSFVFLWIKSLTWPGKRFPNSLMEF